MRFDVLTIFPAMLEAALGDSIIGRAREAGLPIQRRRRYAYDSAADL